VVKSRSIYIVYLSWSKQHHCTFTIRHHPPTTQQDFANCQSVLHTSITRIGSLPGSSVALGEWHDELVGGRSLSRGRQYGRIAVARVERGQADEAPRAESEHGQRIPLGRVDTTAPTAKSVGGIL
jgi:hypothetical protein